MWHAIVLNLAPVSPPECSHYVVVFLTASAKSKYIKFILSIFQAFKDIYVFIDSFFQCFAFISEKSSSKSDWGNSTNVLFKLSNTFLNP
jgi:hypothetical protein